MNPLKCVYAISNCTLHMSISLNSIILHCICSCIQVDTPQGELSSVDTSHIYHGEVLGEPTSHVFGSIIDGIFEGKIITDTHAYYVENAKHYFPNRTHLDQGFHSIIYNERDVIDDPYAHKRKGKNSTSHTLSSRDISFP